jgi:hypothetical protein
MTAARPQSRKYFTPAQANAALPLVRAIVGDIVHLAQELRDRHETLARLRQADRRSSLSAAHQEELDLVQAEFERGRERMQELEQELADLGIELKDYFTGLVDFWCRMDGRDVYLCWKLGEPEVAHWHELNAGFAGRRKLTVDAVTR